MIRLTRNQVRAVDRIAIEIYHIPGIVLMENAARAAADVAWQMADNAAPYFMIMCGGGNNGGDGYAIARHLKNRGATVHLLAWSPPEQLAGDALTNYQIISAMNLPVLRESEFMSSELLLTELESPGRPLPHRAVIIDAVFGTGLSAPPRPPFQKLVTQVQESKMKVLAIDLPSGLDCDTGLPHHPCIRATKTVTFVAEKAGFANPASTRYTGEVIVADIGCPREIIDEVLRTIPPS